MGFAQLGVFAVLMTSAVVFGSFAVNSLMNMQQELRDAEALRDQREAAVRSGSISIAAPAYIPGLDRATIVVTNTGAGVFNASRTDVVIDGVVRSQNISSILIGGVATDVWSPLSILTIVVDDVTSVPTDVIVVTDSGVKGYWRI